MTMDVASGIDPAQLESQVLTPEQQKAQDGLPREEMEAKVKAGLAALRGEDPDEDPNSGGEDTPNNPVEGEDKPAETESSTDETDETEDGKPGETGETGETGKPSEDGELAKEAAADGPEVDSDVPTLPDSYRRSLYAYDWTDEEIDQNLKVLGGSFVATAAKIHANRNTELSGFAAAGRALREQQQVPTEPQDVPNQQAQQSTLKTIEPVDLTKLQDTYGDDPALQEFFNKLNATVETVNAIIPTLQAGQQAAQEAESQQVLQQVDTFFADGELKAYTDLYGITEKGFTTEQLTVRNNLLETAFDLMTGAAQLRNQKLPLNEALGQAHEIVSRDYKATATRKAVVRSAKTRNKGITIRPSSSGKTSEMANVGEPKDRAELEARTRRRLKLVFPG